MTLFLCQPSVCLKLKCMYACMTLVHIEITAKVTYLTQDPT